MADSVDTEPTADDPGTAEAQESVESSASQCARYADMAVELGYCSRERADAALSAGVEAEMDLAGFGAYLVEEGAITREQARACERALSGRSSIGGFAILEKVGQGGMGTVFRAKQISMDRIVAVKILAPKYAQDPSFKQRFLNEARTCAKLSHLNIINGIDCGEDSGFTYFAMEFVDGRTVKQILSDKDRLEPDEAFKIVRQIADALAYARKFEMVHRDIKPDNIMLTPSGTAKLCDLGLAMQSEQSEQNEAVSEEEQAAAEVGDGNADAGENGAAAKQKKKERGLALGTPHYMSPEQARGERTIDARSDIYSLGATFYHLLTGKTMFTGKSSHEVMTRQVVHEALNPCVLDPQIPAGLGMVISKMTAKKPADRYAGAEELIADLDAIKNGTMPTAAAFGAKTSCAILPPEQLSRYLSGGSPRWLRMLPHLAAALLLGIVAYYAAVYFGGKGGEQIASNPNSGTADVHPAPTPAHVPTNSAAVVAPSPTTKTIETPANTVKAETQKVDPKPVINKVATVEPPPQPAKIVTPEIEKPPEPPPVEAHVEKPPEIPRPPLVLNADILYARFLQEYENLQDADLRAGKFDLAKFYAALAKLAQIPDYAIAKKDIDAELADVKSAIEYEKKAAKRIGDSKGEIALPPDKAKLFNATKGKVLGYDDQHGLNVGVQGAEFPIPIGGLSPEFLVANSPDPAALAKVQFLFARGSKAGFPALIPQMPPAEQKRWERKLQLLTDKEIELTAREAFKNLAMIAEAKSWGTFSEMYADFVKAYEKTATMKNNLPQIRAWQELALKAMEPPNKWRKVFHAASVRDVPGRKGEPQYIELIYDFKTPEQANDFKLAEGHGPLKVENGRLIVPPGGGDFAYLRFVAPFASIQSFKAEGKSLHGEQRPMGIVFIEVLQFLTGPNPSNPLLKLDPETKTAMLDNLPDVHNAVTGAPPTFNWLKDVTLGFKSTFNKGEKAWTVDDKLIGEARLPKQFSGGWIALWGSQGNQSWGNIQIVFQPDEDWNRPIRKEKIDKAVNKADTPVDVKTKE